MINLIRMTRQVRCNVVRFGEEESRVLSCRNPAMRRSRSVSILVRQVTNALENIDSIQRSDSLRLRCALRLTLTETQLGIMRILAPRDRHDFHRPFPPTRTTHLPLDHGRRRPCILGFVVGSQAPMGYTSARYVEGLARHDVLDVSEGRIWLASATFSAIFPFASHGVHLLLVDDNGICGSGADEKSTGEVILPCKLLKGLVRAHKDQRSANLPVAQALGLGHLFDHPWKSRKSGMAPSLCKFLKPTVRVGNIHCIPTRRRNYGAIKSTLGQAEVVHSRTLPHLLLYCAVVHMRYQ